MIAYETLAARVVSGGVVLDPWLDGTPRLGAAPLYLSSATAAAMARVAEELAELHQELALLCASEPELVRGFVGLTPFQAAIKSCLQIITGNAREEIPVLLGYNANELATGVADRLSHLPVYLFIAHFAAGNGIEVEQVRDSPSIVPAHRRTVKSLAEMTG